MELFVVGINHRTSPVGFREQLALSEETLAEALQAMRSVLGLKEVVAVSTCNRVEIYGVGQIHPGTRREIIDLISSYNSTGTYDDWEGVKSNVFLYSEEECIQHLFRMVSSLDSLVVGETEIVGQVKRAYDFARRCGMTGPLLNRLFQTSFNVSKTVRTRSGIGRNSVSVGSIAADLALHALGEGSCPRTVLMIGAGKMTETALQHLGGSAAVSVLVANRSLERAVELAQQFQGRPLGMNDIPKALLCADIVISSTSAPHHILGKEDIAAVHRLRSNRPLVLIDLAVPRDIHPDVLELDDVHLYNIDQLSAQARINLEGREAEAVLAENLVAEEVRKKSRQLLRIDASPFEVSARRSVRSFQQAVATPNV